MNILGCNCMATVTTMSSVCRICCWWQGKRAKPTCIYFSTILNESSISLTICLVIVFTDYTASGVLILIQDDSLFLERKQLLTISFLYFRSDENFYARSLVSHMHFNRSL